MNRNQFKPTCFGSVWFFMTKTGSNRFGLVFSVWLDFGSVFSGLVRFFSFARLFWFGSVFFSVLVQFGFFGFRLIKPKPNRTGRFFQNFNRFNRFFFTVWFFQLFFFQFFQFNWFFDFFAHPYFTPIKTKEKTPHEI
jgi:hypothetical protein